MLCRPYEVHIRVYFYAVFAKGIDELIEIGSAPSARSGTPGSGSSGGSLLCPASIGGLDAVDARPDEFIQYSSSLCIAGERFNHFLGAPKNTERFVNPADQLHIEARGLTGGILRPWRPIRYDLQTSHAA